MVIGTLMNKLINKQFQLKSKNEKNLQKECPDFGLPIFPWRRIPNAAQYAVIFGHRLFGLGSE
ncbi:hypothetical protein GCM10007422_43870 [Pedobacter zeae]|uniref:Uncharacterized protein n=1 Tax=Pedobacter zeae TaxID=1737356 RepID=A0ABQ1YBZ4_9SPHI|nr:hypothetical protein GCM10007422_43870 [Pedobacter zeae]